MLIVGNVANRHYLNTIPDTSIVEVAFLEGLDEKVKAKLGITTEPIHTNCAGDTYFENGKHYVLYSTAKVPAFKHILVNTMNQDLELTVASPLVTYAWANMKSRFLHTSLKEWEDNIEITSHLYNKYIQYSSSSMRQSTLALSLHFTVCGAMGRKSTYKEFAYSEYNYYTEDSLLDLFRSGSHSAYKVLVLSSYGNNNKILSTALWKKFPFKGKINAILERLYVDTANEYLLPELIEKTETGLSSEVLFKTSVMNLCSQSKYKWLTDFIIHNYEHILYEFEENYANCLYEAINFNCLDEVLVNKTY